MGAGGPRRREARAKNWADFPIAPGALVHRAKWVLAEPQFGGCATTAAWRPTLSSARRSSAKEEFLGALGNFKLQDAFDINENYHAFRADPFQPGRVVGDADDRGAHRRRDADARRADGQGADAPPQSFSLIFDKDGLVKELTVGYPIDRRVGNTGGLGGAFAFFYGVGKPRPDPGVPPVQAEPAAEDAGLGEPRRQEDQGARREVRRVDRCVNALSVSLSL